MTHAFDVKRGETSVFFRRKTILVTPEIYISISIYTALYHLKPSIHTQYIHIWDYIRRTKKKENPCISPGNWCCTSEEMPAYSEGRDTPYHFQYAQQVSACVAAR